MRLKILLIGLLTVLLVPINSVSEELPIADFDPSNPVIHALLELNQSCQNTLAQNTAPGDFDPTVYLNCTMECMSDYSYCQEDANTSREHCYDRADAISEQYDLEVQVELYLDLISICDAEWQDDLQRCSRKFGQCMQGC